MHMVGALTGKPLLMQAVTYIFALGQQRGALHLPTAMHRALMPMCDPFVDR